MDDQEHILCRICSKDSTSGISLFDLNQRMLARWTRTKMPTVRWNDRLSQTICLPCVDYIRDLIHFEGKSNKSQSNLAAMKRSSIETEQSDKLNDSEDSESDSEVLPNEMSTSVPCIASTSLEPPKKKMCLSIKAKSNLVKKYNLKTFNISLVRLNQETIDKYVLSKDKSEVETVKIKNKPGPKRSKINSVTEINEGAVAGSQDSRCNGVTLNSNSDAKREKNNTPEEMAMDIEAQLTINNDEATLNIHSIESALSEELSNKLSQKSNISKEVMVRKKRKYTKKLKIAPDVMPDGENIETDASPENSELPPITTSTPSSSLLSTETTSPSKLPEQKITLVASSSQNSAVILPFNPALNNTAVNDESSNASTIIAPRFELEEISTQTSPLEEDETDISNSQNTQESTSNLDSNSQVSQDTSSQSTFSNTELTRVEILHNNDENTNNAVDSNTCTTDSQNASENELITPNSFENPSFSIPPPLAVQNNCNNDVQNQDNTFIDSSNFHSIQTTDLYVGIENQNENNTLVPSNVESNEILNNEIQTENITLQNLQNANNEPQVNASFCLPVSTGSIQNQNGTIETVDSYDNSNHNVSNESQSTSYIIPLNIHDSKNSEVQTEDLNPENVETQFNTTYVTPITIQQIQNLNSGVQNENSSHNFSDEFQNNTFIAPMYIQPISRVEAENSYGTRYENVNNENQPTTTYITPVQTNHRDSIVTLENERDSRTNYLFSPNQTQIANNSSVNGTYISTEQIQPPENSNISRYAIPLQSSTSNASSQICSCCDTSSNGHTDNDAHNNSCIPNGFTPVQNSTYYGNSIQNTSYIASESVNTQHNCTYVPQLQSPYQNFAAATQNTSYITPMSNQTAPTYIPPSPLPLQNTSDVPTPSTSSYNSHMTTKNTVKKKPRVVNPGAKSYLKYTPKRGTKREQNTLKRPSPINPAVRNTPVRPIGRKKVVATPVPSTQNETSQMSQNESLQLNPNSLYSMTPVQNPNVITPFYPLNSDISTERMNSNFTPYISTTTSTPNPYEQISTTIPQTTEQPNNIINSVSDHSMSYIPPFLQNSNTQSHNYNQSTILPFTPSNNSLFVTPNYLNTSNFSPMYQTQTYISPQQQQQNSTVLQTVPMQATYPMYAYPMSTVPPSQSLPVYPPNTNQPTSTITSNGMFYYHYTPQ